MNKQLSYFPVRIAINGNETLIRKPSGLPTGEAFTIIATHVGRSHPHRSTEVDEKYFHVNVAFELANRDFIGGTVFMRKEPDGWVAAFCRCAAGDTFNRSLGRNIARRRYFAGECFSLNDNEEPNYDTAQKIVVAEGELLEDQEEVA